MVTFIKRTKKEVTMFFVFEYLRIRMLAYMPWLLKIPFWIKSEVQANPDEGPYTNFRVFFNPSEELLGPFDFLEK